MKSLLHGIVLSSCLLTISLPSAASCLGSGDAEIEGLAKDIGRQPYQALEAINQALNSEQGLTMVQRSWLEAARAQALPENHPAFLQLQIASLRNTPLSESTRESIDAMKQTLA